MELETEFIFMRKMEPSIKKKNQLEEEEATKMTTEEAETKMSVSFILNSTTPHTYEILQILFLS